MKSQPEQKFSDDRFEIFAALFEEEHVFRVNDLSISEIEKLNRKVCWSYTDLNHPSAVVRFGDDYFSRAGETNIRFSTDEPKLNYQLKAMTLGLLFLGTIQGGNTLKWNSVVATIRTLNVFSKLCIRNNITCLFALNTQQALKLRTILSEFVIEDPATPITSYDRLNALSTLHKSGIVSCNQWMQSFHEIRSRLPPRANLRVLGHPIIPTGILKNLIQDSCEYIAEARSVWPEYRQIIELATSKVATSKAKKLNHLFNSSLYPNRARASELRQKYFQHLSLHTSVLVLAFTGMRVSELISMKNYCAIEKKDKNETTHFIEAFLKKGDDDVIRLDWVTNKITFDAVTLLSDHNQLIYEVGNEILNKQQSLVPEHLVHQFKYCSQESQLLALRSGFSFPRFNKLDKSQTGESNLSFEQLHYPLNEEDINQLQELNCNHKDIKGEHRGQPYKTGEEFKFSAHKFRHTFGWLVVSTKLGDIDDIKYQFKHLGVAMTHIYTNRAHEHLSSLADVIDVFNQKAQELIQQTIVNEASSSNLAGGGGEIIVRAVLKELNRFEDGQFNLEQQPHIPSSEVVLNLLNQHGGNLTFLTNGVCIRGAKCQSINSLNSCGTAHCPTFIATTKNLPYWKTVKRNAENQKSAIQAKPIGQQAQYQNLLASADKTIEEASRVIERLSSSENRNKASKGG